MIKCKLDCNLLNVNYYSYKKIVFTTITNEILSNCD